MTRGRALCALRIARPEEWERIVRAALSEGYALAPGICGVSSRTWARWMRELGVVPPRPGGARVGSGRRKKEPTIDRELLDNGVR